MIIQNEKCKVQNDIKPILNFSFCNLHFAELLGRCLVINFTAYIIGVSIIFLFIVANIEGFVKQKFLDVENFWKLLFWGLKVFMLVSFQRKIKLPVGVR